MTGDAGRAGWLEQARSSLRAAGPVLARLIEERPDFDPRAWLARLPPMDLFGALLFQVAGQQLSVAATRAALARGPGRERLTMNGGRTHLGRNSHSAPSRLRPAPRGKHITKGRPR